MQVDQAHLETVLPSVGGAICILKGTERGSKASLEAIDVDKFKAKVSMKAGEALWMEYEDICKLSS